MRAVGLLAGALLIAVPGTPGQSLLSEPAPAIRLEAGAAESLPAPPQSEDQPPEIYTLLEMANRGQGVEAYPHLRALFEEELFSNLLNRDYLRDLHRRLLVALLKAGEGRAPPEEREKAARIMADLYPDDPYFPFAFFALTRALYRQGKPLAESFFFDEQALDALPARSQTLYLVMHAQTAERDRDFTRAALYRLMERESDTTLRESTRGDILHLLRQIPRVEDLDAIMARFFDVDWLLDEEPFLRAKVFSNSGRWHEALLALEAIDRSGRALTASQIRILRDTREEIERDLLTRPFRIGVLLPLSSSNAALRELARETLDGLRTAVQFPGASASPLKELGRYMEQDLEPPRQPFPTDAGKSSIELVIKDTANSPRQAAQRVEELVRRDRVIAIVGPVARVESAAAMAKAEEVGVPILTLSITAAIPPDPVFAFRHNQSQEEEVRDLVRYAMDYLAARRFAVLYPDNRYGRKMMELFWNEVIERGGSIAGAAAFLPVSAGEESRTAAGLKAIFEHLTGMDRYVLPEDRELIKAVDDDGPDPVVEFDALYIPVSAGGGLDLRLIAPYPTTVDAENEHLLGSRYWNSEAVLIAGAGKLNGASFVDFYHRTNRTPENRDFRRRHRYLFRHRPDYRAPTFYTALGYDSLGILVKLLEDPANRIRRRLARAIVEMPPYSGLTGLTSFLETGESVKESIVLRIAGGEIVPAIPEAAR